MFDKKSFTSNVSEIIAKISEKSHTQVNFYLTNAEADIITVITRDDESLNLIAATLCEEDYLVYFVGDGSNFLQVRTNPCPTPKEYVITHIPITYLEAIDLIKNAGFGVVEDTSKGVKHVTAVGGNNVDHDSLAKIVHALSTGGIMVNYLGVGNFFEFDEVQASSAFKNATNATMEKLTQIA